MAKTKVAAVGNLLLIFVLIAMALGEPGKTTRMALPLLMKTHRADVTVVHPTLVTLINR